MCNYHLQMQKLLFNASCCLLRVAYKFPMFTNKRSILNLNLWEFALNIQIKGMDIVNILFYYDLAYTYLSGCLKPYISNCKHNLFPKGTPSLTYRVQQHRTLRFHSDILWMRRTILCNHIHWTLSVFIISVYFVISQY